MLNQAVVKELKAFILDRAFVIGREGYKMVETRMAYNSYKAMRKGFLASDKVIIVSTEGNEGTIYGEEVNMFFRFWHDATHLRLDKDFSLDGELAVIFEHMQEAGKAGLSFKAQEMLYMDTAGQVKYYYKHKAFIKDQLEFVEACLTYGLDDVIESGLYH